MGMNANFARIRAGIIQLPKINGNDKQEDGKVDDKPAEPPKTSQKDCEEKIDALVNTYTYFSVYEGITSRLGNFYSECLSKMTGIAPANKRVLNELYNGAMTNVINGALESAKNGSKLDFNELAQQIKDQVTTELEKCDYNPAQYYRNMLDKNIMEDHYKKFKQ